MWYILFLIVLAAVPGYVLVESSSYMVNEFDNSGGPGVFPIFVACAMLILLIIKIGMIIVNRKSQPLVLKELFTSNIGVFLVSLIIYAILMPYLGFIISSSLYLTGLSGFLGYRNKGNIKVKTMLIRCFFYVTFSVGMYLFFMNTIGVYLPAGLLSFS